MLRRDICLENGNIRHRHLPKVWKHSYLAQIVNDDDSVIAGWCEHALCTSLSLRTGRIVDGRTQCMPLSATIVNRRSAGRERGTQSMLVLTVAHKPVARLFHEV